MKAKALFFAFLVAMWGRLAWPNVPASRWAILPVLVMLSMAGCSAQAPMPAPIPAPVLCVVPVAMSEPEPAPAQPIGDYSQRDVALYLDSLYRWGERGWLKVAHIRDWSAACGDDDNVTDQRGNPWAK